jgi:predicted GTPase
LKIAVHSSTGTIASKRVESEAKRQAKRVKVGEDVEYELKLSGDTYIDVGAQAKRSVKRKRLIEEEDEDNFATKKTCTSLIKAAAEGPVDAVRSLVSSGADLDTRNIYGNTSLIVATEKASWTWFAVWSRAGC